MTDDDDNKHWLNAQNNYNVNTRIMLMATVCLFIVVVVILVLHIYARRVFRRHQRRRAAMQFLAAGVAPAQVGARDALAVGLNPTVLASLPVITYKKLEESSALECAVCISTIVDGETIRVLLNCRHTFHSECIDIWLSTHSTCPVCRTSVEPNLAQTGQVEREQSTVVNVPATAPVQDLINSMPSLEGTSEPKAQPSVVGGSSSRLGSFRRILSRGRSGRRAQPEGTTDIERQ